MNKNTLIALIVILILFLVLFFTLGDREEEGGSVDINATSTLDADDVSDNDQDGGEDPEEMEVEIALIALEGQGAPQGKKIGCGDTVVMVDRTVAYSEGTLQAAFNELLSIDEREVGRENYYNSLYQSNLSLDSVSIQNGTAYIELSGRYQLGGTCDTPRFQAQLEETALQFSTVRDVEITLNGKSLDEALSSQ